MKGEWNLAAKAHDQRIQLGARETGSENPVAA